MISQTTPLLSNDANDTIALIEPTINNSIMSEDKKTNNVLIDKNSCIICLEEEDNDKQILQPKDLNFLTKNCPCHFYIHEKCFNLWFFQKSVCPICALPLLYQESLYVPIITYKNGDYVYIENTKGQTCLRSMLLYVILFMTAIILINIFSGFI